jgi:hypothetical protein
MKIAEKYIEKEGFSYYYSIYNSLTKYKPFANMSKI